MLIDGVPHRTFRLDRLFFRYLSGTFLGKIHSVDSLATLLESMGYVRVDWQSRRYAELRKLQEFKTRDRFLEHLSKELKGEL